MATFTSRLTATKPASSENVSITTLNNNFDLFDAAVGASVGVSASRPASAFSGRLWFSSDSKRFVVNTAASASTAATWEEAQLSSFQFPTTGSQLQSMLDAQNADTAGPIILGPYTYSISTALQLYDGSTIWGMGDKQSIISYTGTGGNAIEPDNQSVRGYSWNLQGFQVIDAGTGAVGINMIKQSTCYLANVKVDGFTTGISLTGSNGDAVYNRFFGVQIANATTGILCGTAGSNSNTFYGCRTNVCTTAVNVTDSNQCVFSGCQFESGTTGVSITSTSNALSDHTTIVGCRFENLSGVRVHVTSSNVRYTNIIANAFFSGGTDITDSGTRTLILDSFNGIKMNPSANKPTVTGSKGGNAALASLLTGLAGLGLVTDSSS